MDAITSDGHCLIHLTWECDLVFFRTLEPCEKLWSHLVT